MNSVLIKFDHWDIEIYQLYKLHNIHVYGLTGVDDRMHQRKLFKFLPKQTYVNRVAKICLLFFFKITNAPKVYFSLLFVESFSVLSLTAYALLAEIHHKVCWIWTIMIAGKIVVCVAVSRWTITTNQFNILRPNHGTSSTLLK